VIRSLTRTIVLCIALLLFGACRNSQDTVVIVSANAEWRALLAELKPEAGDLQPSPYGQWFVGKLPNVEKPLLFFHGGWGKVDAAASAQWALSKWNPRLVVNIGTAGGFPGRVREGDVVFVTHTIIYDIIERMGSAAEAIQDYTTQLDPPPPGLSGLVIPSAILSADQDIDPRRVPELMRTYNVVAADWESASIARVCKKNNVRVMILRGISDVVDVSGSRTYGNAADFEAQSKKIMLKLLAFLPVITSPGI
jgi:adenosylhomocysteine nucleosidase